MRSSTTGAASSTTPTIVVTQAPTATTGAVIQAESTKYSTQVPKNNCYSMSSSYGYACGISIVQIGDRDHSMLIGHIRTSDTLLLDAGAAVHVCSRDYADDYPPTTTSRFRIRSIVAKCFRRVSLEIWLPNCPGRSSSKSLRLDHVSFFRRCGSSFLCSING